MQGQIRTVGAAEVVQHAMAAPNATAMREIGVYWYLFSNHYTRKCTKEGEGATVIRQARARLMVL